MKRNIALVVCITTLISMSSTLFAFNVASLDTLIQRAGESIKPSDTFKQFNTSIDKGNIYSSSYKLVQQAYATTILNTIASMAGEINGKHNCTMDINDMGNILLSIGSISNQIQGALAVVRENIPSRDNTSFSASCSKLIQCMEGKNKTRLSDDGLIKCKNYTQQVYDEKASIVGPTVDLTATTQGNDVFYNGEAGDAPYDILLDMQRIGDVLFSDNQKTDKTLFFTFPNNSIAGFQTIGFDNDTTNNSVNNPVVFNSTNNGNQSVGQTNQNTSQQNQQNSNLPSLPTNSGNTYTSILPIQGSINPTSVTNTTSIENYTCSSPAATTLSGNINSVNTDTTTINDNGYQDIYTNGGIDVSNSGQGTFDSNTPFYSPLVGNSDDPIIDNADWESPDEFKTQEANIKSCTNKCEGLKTVDKTMCIAKCTCGTAYTKNGLFGLSICTVPSQQNAIGGTKTVQSIEDIVSEINNILLALKNSGEMIKHTKTTEMFDTSLSKIKINKIFAFDINIGFKPILDAKPNLKSNQESQDETDKSQNGNYSSIDIRSERNKYVTLFNPIEQDARKKIAINTQSQQDNLRATALASVNTDTLTDAKIQALSLSQNAEVADIVRKFLEQNIRFFSYLSDSLSNLQITSEQFKQKIEAGQ